MAEPSRCAAEGAGCSRPGSEPDGYCLMHSPNPGKSAERFVDCLKAQLEQGDFNFREYMFPCAVGFRNRKFSTGRNTSDIDFREAQFSGEADFGGAQFSGVAHFRGAQ
jgi:hypothetical protein